MSLQDSRREAIADACVHVFGVAAGTVAFAVLVAVAAERGDARLIISVLLYGFGLLAMLACSALYNMAREGGRKAVLRRLDHAAIFVMIAGSYTPFALVAIGGPWGWGLLAVVWTAGAAGVLLKLAWPRRLEGLSVVLYLLLGWVIVVALGPLLAAVPLPAVVLLGAGGVLYSVGVVFHLWERLPYNKAIWHALVLAAAGCHYAAILGWVGLAGPGA